MSWDSVNFLNCCGIPLFKYILCLIRCHVDRHLGCLQFLALRNNRDHCPEPVCLFFCQRTIPGAIERHRVGDLCLAVLETANW